MHMQYILLHYSLLNVCLVDFMDDKLVATLTLCNPVTHVVENCNYSFIQQLMLTSGG